jgi:predicted methyltransferase
MQYAAQQTEESLMISTRFRFARIALGAFILVGAAPSPLTSPARPEADMKRDADRKPMEMLAFAKVKDGQTVVDFLPGGGYFTRIFSAAVGPKGKVVAAVPEGFIKRRPEALTALNALAAEAGRANISVVQFNGTQLAAPGTADLVWTSQNYHDIHNGPPEQIAGLNKSVFTALKKGGVYIVLDHAAEAGSGARDTNTLHRIDPALVKTEVKAAGFVFDGESKALRNTEDKHTLKVFDPALRGHTDQFVYRFRKP